MPARDTSLLRDVQMKSNSRTNNEELTNLVGVMQKAVAEKATNSPDGGIFFAITLLTQAVLRIENELIRCREERRSVGQQISR